MERNRGGEKMWRERVEVCELTWKKVVHSEGQGWLVLDCWVLHLLAWVWNLDVSQFMAALTRPLMSVPFSSEARSPPLTPSSATAEYLRLSRIAATEPNPVKHSKPVNLLTTEQRIDVGSALGKGLGGEGHQEESDRKTHRSYRPIGFEETLFTAIESNTHTHGD